MIFFRANDAASSDDRRDHWSSVAASIDVIPVSGGHSAVRLGDQAVFVAEKISQRL